MLSKCNFENELPACRGPGCVPYDLTFRFYTFLVAVKWIDNSDLTVNIFFTILMIRIKLILINFSPYEFFNAMISKKHLITLKVF